MHKQVRHSTQEEQEEYERMLEGNGSPLIEKQGIMGRTNRLMMQLGRMREENMELRELIEMMWMTHCGQPTAYGWVAVMEEAERLGITLEYPK